MASNLDLTSSMLIRTLCEISGPAQVDAMELGAIDLYGQDMENEVAQVNTRGRIAMPTAFDSMMELLTTLNDALPNNAFLRKWLKFMVGKEELPSRGNRAHFRGGRGHGGYKGQFGRNPSRNLRNREVEVEDPSLEDLKDIEVTLEASGEILPVNNVAQVGGTNQTCNNCSPEAISAPSFKKHALHSRKSIHILVKIKGMKSTTLIECGATNNFINLAFMRKKGLEPLPLSQPRTRKLGEGTTKVTHGYASTLEVGDKRIPVDSYVMNGRSSQGLVLGYTFLAENDATINFRSRELRLGGMNVHYLSSHLEKPNVMLKEADEVKNVMDVAGRLGLLSAEECRLWSEETRMVSLKAGSNEWIRKQIEMRRSIALNCGLVEQWNERHKIVIRNEEDKPVYLRVGFVVGYLQKNN